MANTLHTAGDVIVDSIVLLSEENTILNITNHVLELELYESIEDVFMSGHVVINDGVSLYNFFPFIGKEIIEINIRTPNFPDSAKISKRFYVHRISDKESDGRVGIYTLYFSSYEYITDNTTKISRAFKGSAHEIVETLVGSEYLNSTTKCQLEDSTNYISFVSNFWTPTRCIEYVCQRALSYKGNPSFLFFQNHNGLLFVSLDALFHDVKHNIYQIFVYTDNDNTLSNTSTQKSSISEDYMRIIDYKLNTDYDVFTKLHNGYYGGASVTYNTGTHQYNYVVKNPSFDGVNHLNQYSPVPLIRPKNDGNMTYIPTTLNTFNGIYDHTDLKMRIDREAIMARLASTEIDIVVNGRCDYTVGQIVSVVLPKDRQYVSNENRDMVLSGNYLVKSIVHNIVRGKHTCILGLCKDSYLFDINRSAMTKDV